MAVITRKVTCDWYDCDEEIDQIMDEEEFNERFFGDDWVAVLLEPDEASMKTFCCPEHAADYLETE